MKTSSLSDHTSKVTANNGALSKPIHAQGMDWQWRISASRLYEATQLFHLPSVHNQTSAVQCHNPINTAFVLAWHHCFVFIKISLLWHRSFFVWFPTKLRTFPFCFMNNDVHSYLILFSLCRLPEPHVSLTMERNMSVCECTLTDDETKTIFPITINLLCTSLLLNNHIIQTNTLWKVTGAQWHYKSLLLYMAVRERLLPNRCWQLCLLLALCTPCCQQ